MIRAEETADVRSDVETTFAYLSSIEHYPDWLPGVTAAQQTSDGPLGVGTTFTLLLAGPTGPIEATGAVTELDAPGRLGVRGSASAGNVAGGLSLEPIEAGCRLRVWMELELRGMYRFAEGMVRRELETSLPGVLIQLRARLEALPEPGATG